MTLPAPVNRRILVATDLGSASDRTVETAAALATGFAAELTVLHVDEEPALAYPFAAHRGEHERARAYLDDVVTRLRTRMFHVEGVLRDGIAWREIVSTAERLGADLVVVGSGGRRGLPRFVLGSTAERVVRTSPIPVLTVHRYDDVAILAGGMHRFRHVLAPTNFSDDSRRGVQLAASIARDLEAKLTLVYAFEAPSTEYYAAFEMRENILGEACRQLCQLAASVRERVPWTETAVVAGTPWRAILDLAKQRGADLVVMSTSGRRGVQHALAGSVAEKIVRLARVPVLTVGPPTRD